MNSMLPRFGDHDLALRESANRLVRIMEMVLQYPTPEATPQRQQTNREIATKHGYVNSYQVSRGLGLSYESFLIALHTGGVPAPLVHRDGIFYFDQNDIDLAASRQVM
jgi:hypothetical protein